MSWDGEADRLKRQAARRALEFVRDGMVIGLGSGSTAEISLTELAGRARAGLRVVGVPTSRKTEHLARQLGLTLASLDDYEQLDLTIDGADEIQLDTFALIKGRGGSLLREKLVAVATRELIIIAHDSKVVTALGEHEPLPVEVVQFGWRQTAAALERLGCQTSLRQGADGPFVSDEGHFVLDCRFRSIPDPPALARQVKALVGVVEHGLFLNLAHRLVIASRSGVQLYERTE